MNINLRYTTIPDIYEIYSCPYPLLCNKDSIIIGSSQYGRIYPLSEQELDWCRQSNLQVKYDWTLSFPSYPKEDMHSITVCLLESNNGKARLCIQPISYNTPIILRRTPDKVYAEGILDSRGKCQPLTSSEIKFCLTHHIDVNDEKEKELDKYYTQFITAYLYMARDGSNLLVSRGHVNGADIAFTAKFILDHDKYRYLTEKEREWCDEHEIKVMDTCERNGCENKASIESLCSTCYDEKRKGELEDTLKELMDEDMYYELEEEKE